MPVTEENFHEIKRSFVNRGWKDTLTRYSLSIPQAKVVQNSLSYQGFVSGWNSYKYKNELKKIKKNEEEHTDVGNRIHFSWFSSNNTANKSNDKEQEKPVKRTRRTIQSIVPANGTPWFTHNQLVSLAKDLKSGLTFIECSQNLGFKSSAGLYCRLSRDPEALKIVRDYSGRNIKIESTNDPPKRSKSKKVKVVNRNSKSSVEVPVVSKTEPKPSVEQVDPQYIGCVKFYKRDKVNNISVAMFASAMFMSAILAIMKIMEVIDIAWYNCLMPLAVFAIVLLVCIFINGLVCTMLFGNFPNSRVKIELERKKRAGK